MKRLTLILIAVLGILVLAGCGKSTDGTLDDYAWPDECYTTTIDADGAEITTLCEDALIPSTVTDPKSTSIGLRLANTAAITAGLYSADQAMTVLEEVEAFAESADTYASLAAYILGKVKLVNNKAGVAVFVTLVSEFADQQTPISPCDLAILKVHLAKQKLILVSLGASSS